MKKVTDNFRKILSPFLKAGIKVLSELTDMKFTRQDVYSFTGNKSIGDVKIEIEIQGDIKSRVVFDMPRDFAFKLAQIMVGDETLSADSELLQSAILEMGNMISGNAMGFLEEYKINSDIKTPQAYIGKDKALFSEKTQIGVIEFTSELGPFNIYVVMEEEQIPVTEGILLVHIPDNITQHIVEFFMPKGLGVFSASTEQEGLNAVKNQKISLVFANQISSYTFDIYSFIDKILRQNPAARILFFSIQSDWDKWVKNNRISEIYPHAVLGFVPRSIDSFRIVKTLMLVLEKINIKLAIKRKPVLIKVTKDDKTKTVIYPLQNPDKAKDDEVILGELEEISLEHALIEIPAHLANVLKSQDVIPRLQFNLKGAVIRAKAKVLEKNKNKIHIAFMDISGDGTLKMASFIHYKLSEQLK